MRKQGNSEVLLHLTLKSTAVKKKSVPFAYQPQEHSTIHPSQKTGFFVLLINSL